MTNPRPSSASFWSSYLNYLSYSAETVWRTIGGGIGKSYGPKSNSCAARVSYGLNYGGAPIKIFGGASKNLPYHVYEGKAGDGMRYIVSARQMVKYLTLQWPTIDHHVTTEHELNHAVAALTGAQCAIFAASGHVGVLKAGYSDPYVRSYLPVDVWVLP